jgi:hypothetical protein
MRVLYRPTVAAVVRTDNDGVSTEFAFVCIRAHGTRF